MSSSWEWPAATFSGRTAKPLQLHNPSIASVLTACSQFACSYSVVFAHHEPAACSVVWRRWDKTVDYNVLVDRNYCRLLVGCACVCPFSPLGDPHIPTISTMLPSTRLRPVSSCRRVQNMCLSVPCLGSCQACKSPQTPAGLMDAAANVAKIVGIQHSGNSLSGLSHLRQKIEDWTLKNR